MMGFSMTHKYIPRIEQREKNLFMEEYYSSTDTQIYINDIEQTEIGYISYSLQEQLKPLYGYASRTFDDVSVGNRIITGMFKVPVKNPEMQTQEEDIIKYASGDTTGADGEKHNKEEEEKLLKADWVLPHRHPLRITAEDTDASPDAGITLKDPAVFEYIEKIMSLPGAEKMPHGYTGNAKDIISSFQASHGLQASGTLTEETKDRIDTAVREHGSGSSFMLMPGTRVYAGPGIAYPYIIITSAQTASQIDRTEDGWAYVVTEDRHYGFVKEGGT